MFQLFCTQSIHEIPNSTSLILSQNQTQKSPPKLKSPNTILIPVPANSTAATSQKIYSIKNTTQKAGSLIQLLRDHRFTPTMVSTIITKNPKILLHDSIKTLKPKLEFFQSSGFSIEDIARLISSKNSPLNRSLTNHLIPFHDLLKKFLNTNKEIVNAMVQMQYCSVNLDNFQVLAEKNFEVLRDHGVPEELMSRMIVKHPRTVTLENDQFKEIVERVEAMKFNPNSGKFVLAVGIMGGMSKLEWEKRVEVYKSFGWSDDEVIAAFTLQPHCMIVSETKTRKLIGFYLNELGLKPKDISKHPNLMMISLEKRVIPRCSVLLVLLRDGLIGKDFHFTSALCQSNKYFEKYVMKYQEVAPDVLKAYHGELENLKWETLREMLKCDD